MANLFYNYAETQCAAKNFTDTVLSTYQTVSASLKNATNQLEPSTNYHNNYAQSSCSDSDCASSSCSCSSTENATLYQNYILEGEKLYQEFNYYFNRFIEKEILSDHVYCLDTIKELTQNILKAIDEDEYFAAADLTVRLADIYFISFTSLSKAFGASKAFTLLDSGHDLLEKAHNLVTHIETPNWVLN